MATRKKTPKKAAPKKAAKKAPVKRKPKAPARKGGVAVFTEDSATGKKYKTTIGKVDLEKRVRSMIEDGRKVLLDKAHLPADSQEASELKAVVRSVRSAIREAAKAAAKAGVDVAAEAEARKAKRTAEKKAVDAFVEANGTSRSKAESSKRQKGGDLIQVVVKGKDGREAPLGSPEAEEIKKEWSATRAKRAPRPAPKPIPGSTKKAEDAKLKEQTRAAEAARSNSKKTRPRRGSVAKGNKALDLRVGQGIVHSIQTVVGDAEEAFGTFVTDAIKYRLKNRKAAINYPVTSAADLLTTERFFVQVPSSLHRDVDLARGCQGLGRSLWVVDALLMLLTSKSGRKVRGGAR